MRPNALLLTSLASLVLTGIAAAIDFTPQFVTTALDGPPVRRPCFVDGKKKFAVTVDAETELTGADGAALFNFTKFSRAVMRLGPSTLKPEINFSVDNIERYRSAAAALLLQGAQQVTLESETANVLPVNNWTSQRFTFTYTFTSIPMRESVTFLNLDDKTQAVMQTRTTAETFAVITARSDDIIRRWHEVTEDSEVVIN